MNHVVSQDLTIIPYLQPIVDMWKREVIGLESTVKGLKNGQTINARPLFVRAVQKGIVRELDYDFRKKSINVGVQKLQGNQRLFVNIAAQSIMASDEWFERDVPFNQITLEITEQKQINLTREVLERFEKLRSKGMKIAIDDYGIGFNNMLLISRIKPDFIKLDRSVATEADIPTLEGIISYCQKMNTQLIAEGIETEQQRDTLLNLGVRYMQGFLFGFPKPFEAYKPLDVV